MGLFVFLLLPFHGPFRHFSTNLMGSHPIPSLIVWSYSSLSCVVQGRGTTLSIHYPFSAQVLWVMNLCWYSLPVARHWICAFYLKSQRGTWDRVLPLETQSQVPVPAWWAGWCKLYMEEGKRHIMNKFLMGRTLSPLSQAGQLSMSPTVQVNASYERHTVDSHDQASFIPLDQDSYLLSWYYAMWVDIYITAPQGLTCWEYRHAGPYLALLETPWLMLFIRKPLTLDFLCGLLCATSQCPGLLICWGKEKGIISMVPLTISCCDLMTSFNKSKRVHLSPTSPHFHVLYCAFELT